MEITFGPVSLTEQRLRVGRRGAVERPLCALAQIPPRGYSRPLQAAMTDFGAEVSFAKAGAVEETGRVVVRAARPFDAGHPRDAHQWQLDGLLEIPQLTNTSICTRQSACA